MTDDAKPEQTAVNDSGTATASGTPLAQRCSPDVLRELIVKRNRVGRLTRKGHLFSNLIKMALWQDEPESNRSWARHPTQNRPWMMGVQVEALARGK
jgi:hypothetical protein